LPKKMLRCAIDWLVYVGVRLVVCMVQAMTLEACHRWVRVLAWLLSDVLPIRRKVVDENLRQAFPQSTVVFRRQINREMWEHLLLMGCEMVHLHRKVHDTNWRDYVRLANVESQVRAFLSPRACVMISGHFGNFEAGGFLNGLFGFRTYTIARPLDNPFLERWLTQLRQQYGQFMLPKWDVARQVAVLLERGENLALLGDQFGGNTGCWVDFFGRPASYHKAIALFSMTSRAPLLVGYARRVNGRPLQFELGVEGVFDPADPKSALNGVREVTQWYNDLLEAIIRRNPEQYWWLHKRYKGEPKQRHRASRTLRAA
jgi:KDO2-lipid IV(A) lauroyltransferase